MGIDKIDLLKQNNFKIKYFGNNYGVIFDDNKIELFEKYICETLENGFWNECAPVRCLIYSRWKSYLVRSNQPLVPRFWSCNCEVTI